MIKFSQHVMLPCMQGKNVKDMPAAIQAWTYVVRLMGRDIMFRSREIVNPMLKVCIAILSGSACSFATGMLPLFVMSRH